MSKTPTCYSCHQTITFDDQHIGKNGKKIPLDPATKTPHDCPMREKTNVERPNAWAGQDKDDHGNESYSPNEQQLIDAVAEKQWGPSRKPDYVDHTLKGQSRVIIFYGRPDNVAEEYNTFLSKNNGKLRTQGAQFQTAQQDDGSVLFAIALYYEEVAK